MVGGGVVEVPKISVAYIAMTFARLNQIEKSNSFLSLLALLFSTFLNYQFITVKSTSDESYALS
jgi:hypothetical protein